MAVETTTFSLRQLRTFVEVARAKSFSAAARNLCATQSAISARIHELEESLGVALFVRGHQHVELTPSGRALVPRVESLLKLASSISGDFGNPRTMAGSLRVGVCEPVALTWLPAFVERVGTEMPQLSLEIDKDLTPRLIRKLQNGKLDIALVAGPVTSFEFLSLSLGSMDFVWVASSAQIVEDRLLTPADISRMPILSLAEHPYEYPAIKRWLHDDTPDRYKLVCNDIALVLRLVGQGTGVSLLALNCCINAIRQRSVQVLRTEPAVPAVEFFAIWRDTCDVGLSTAVAKLAGRTSDFERNAQALSHHGDLNARVG
jgi:DNA-binding transcriptional LysR family regulator